MASTLSYAISLALNHPKDFHDDPRARAACAFVAESMLDSNFVSDVARALTQKKG